MSDSKMKTNGSWCFFNSHDRFGSLQLQFPKIPSKLTDEELEWIALQVEEWAEEFRSVWISRKPDPDTTKEEVASIEYFERLLAMRTHEMRKAWREVWRLRDKIEELEEAQGE